MRPTAPMADKVRSNQSNREDVSHHQRGQQESRNDTSDKEMADGKIGQDSPNHHEQARRNQHPEARATADEAEREVWIVTRFFHLRIGDRGKRRGRGEARPGHERKHHVAENGCIGKTPRNAVQPLIDGGL